MVRFFYFFLFFYKAHCSQIVLCFVAPIRASRLQLTDNLIGELNVSSQADETTKDLQKIEKLLSLPANKTQVAQSRWHQQLVGRWEDKQVFRLRHTPSLYWNGPAAPYRHDISMMSVTCSVNPAELVVSQIHFNKSLINQCKCLDTVS